MQNANTLPVLVLILAGSLSASSLPSPAEADPDARNACWQQAGLSREVLRQRRTIVSDARAQIRAVENDSTQNRSEQHGQIARIRMNVRQQVQKLISPDQLETLRRCRRNRAALRRGATQPDQQ